MRWLVLIFVAIIIWLIVRALLAKSTHQTTPSRTHSPHPSLVSQATQDVQFEIMDDFITITEPSFFGLFSRSPNGRFILAWADSDPSSGRGGARNSGLGSYFLLDGTRILVHGTMQRPHDGKVSNKGSFVLNDWMFTHELAGTFYALTSLGDIFQKRFEANLFNNGISDDGRFAVCQTCNSDNEEDGGVLCLFDLEAKTILTKFTPITGWANDYLFEVEKQILHLIYQDGQDYRYGFDGSFLDAEQYEAHQLHASGYELLGMAEDHLEKMDTSNLTAYSDVLNLLGTALQRGVSENTQARIHRILGEIYHRCNDRVKALEHFESALRLDPKIGVKRLVASLKKT